MIEECKQASFKQIVKPSFRKAFCLKPGFRYGALRPYCQEIVFATDGFKTDLLDISSQLRTSFQHFDPELDCIVPTGTTITSILVGSLLASRYANDPIAVAFFQREVIRDGVVIQPEHYIFYRLYINQLLDF